MKMKLFKILKLLRPKQWIKNLAIFAAITFAGHLFDGEIFWQVFLAFIAFCGLSSSIYIINDIFDIKKDRLHPFKKFRPLANRDLPISIAIILAIALIIGSLILSSMITRSFFFGAIIYLVLQLCYSVVLKHIAVVDILILASGYMLRVYGGEFASGYRVSVWLLLTTIALSLFLAVGKRKSELTLISHLPNNTAREATRKSLSHYSVQLLDVYLSIFATAAFTFYSLFTFLESRSNVTLSILLPDFLPTFFQRKWLMVTIIPVVYGLMRYLQDIYEKHEGESPEKVLLSDYPLLINVAVWVLLVIVIIYFIGG